MYGTTTISALFQKEFLDSKSLQNRIENQIENSKFETENRKEIKTEKGGKLAWTEAHQAGSAIGPDQNRPGYQFVPTDRRDPQREAVVFNLPIGGSCSVSFPQRFLRQDQRRRFATSIRHRPPPRKP
jgi:hypothetical protein